jgi:hypothetical protein
MEGTALQPDSPLVQGYYPRFFFNHSSPIFPMLDQQELVAGFTQAPYEFSDEDFAGFRQLVRLGEDGSVNLIVVEIPTFYSEAMPAFTSEFAEDKERDFEGVILPYAHEHNIPAWRFDDDQWRAHAEFYADPDHLYLSASHIFSEWLGQQIGQASQQGLFQIPVPQSLLTGAPQPILPTVIPSLTTQGFSEQAYATYEAYLQQFDLFPLDARIFTPDSDIFDLDTLRTSLGIYLEWAYPDDLQGEQGFLALIAAFERMRGISELELSASQQEQFNMWRETKLPQHLKDMGFDYIIYSNFWSGWLSEAEWALLNYGRLAVEFLVDCALTPHTRNAILCPTTPTEKSRRLFCA